MPIETKIINRRDPKNLGDIVSVPSRYVDLGLVSYHDIEALPISRLVDACAADANIVVGGGGMLYPPWEPILRKLFAELAMRKRRGALIVWGIGTNNYDGHSPSAPAWIETADLVGLRDVGTPYQWVPCVSCLSPLFDTARQKTRDVVIYEHHAIKAPITDPAIPRLTNAGDQSFRCVIDFLGSARVVLTTSYHGAYWATLLGCRVVVWGRSSKFNFMKHAPVSATDTNWRTYAEQAQCYDTALAESREANLAFARQVKERIEKPAPHARPRKAMRIQVLGEGGGIGDLLPRMGVVRGIKKVLPEAEVWYVLHKRLVPWALDPVLDQLVAVQDGYRATSQIPDPDKYDYLRVGAPFDATIDMHNPAELYENAAIGRVTRGQPDVWCDAASAVLGKRIELERCRIPIQPVIRQQTHAKLQVMLGQLPSFLVGLQPLSYWHWRSINFEQVSGLVTALKKYGAQCVLFHVTADPVAAWAKELGIVALAGEPAATVIEAVRLCDGMITIDSGLFHLSGTLNVPVVGLFAQTDGELTSHGYDSCDWITAGPKEREGLDCEFPCYRRALYGCNRPVCERGCRALQRIAPASAVERLVKLVLSRRGQHLPAAVRATRMFASQYHTNP